MTSFSLYRLFGHRHIISLGATSRGKPVSFVLRGRRRRCDDSDVDDDNDGDVDDNDQVIEQAAAENMASAP